METVLGLESAVERPGDTSQCIAPNLSDPDKFDWSSDDSVLLGEQLAVAVYRNKFDAIVIRQEGVGGDEDHFVVLRDAEAVRLLIAALDDEVGTSGLKSCLAPKGEA